MSLSIKEVAKQKNIAPHTIRYYEKEGLLFDIKRNKAGKRVFTKNNIEQIDIVECLKAAGLTIKEIKEYIHLFKGGSKTYTDRINLFKDRKEIIQNKINILTNELDTVEYKIWYYQNIEKIGNVDDPLNCQKMKKIYENLNCNTD